MFFLWRSIAPVKSGCDAYYRGSEGVASLANHLEREGISVGDFFQPREAARRPGMARIHIDAEQDPMIVCLEFTQSGDPFCRFPIGDARIGKTCHSQNCR